MNIRFIVSFFVILSLSGSSHAQYKPVTPFVVSGVAGDSVVANSIKHFVHYLGQKSNIDFEIYYAENYTELSTVMRENPAAIGWSGAVPYVEDAMSDQQQLVSVPLFNNSPSYYSLIIASVNSNRKNFMNFRDKIFIYSDHRSQSAYVVPFVILKNKNININKYFNLVIKSGSHENSIVALMNGMGDVSSVNEHVWVEYVKRNPHVLKELNEIQRAGPWPFSPVVASKGVSKNLIQELRETLLDMVNTEEGNHILDSLGLDGFSTQPEAFFDPVKDMLNIMGERKRENND